MNEASASQFYISARVSFDGGRPVRLKHNDTFAVLDTEGDLVAFPGNPDGLYHRDTRHLSHFELRINGARPMRLSSDIADNSALTADLTNPDFFEGDQLVLAKDTVHLRRLKFIWDGALFERIAIFNYGEEEYRIRLSLTFDCDFADLFEARGQVRKAVGLRDVKIHTKNAVGFSYQGLDNVERRTLLQFAPAPDHVGTGYAWYDLHLKPNEKRVIFMRTACNAPEDENFEIRDFFKCFAELRRSLRRAAEQRPRISSSNLLIEEVTARSMADITMLTTDTDTGPYPYAGIPWFSTPFGRDGIITAFMMLWVDPQIARGVLNLLAATQAKEMDAYRDAEPGKILHEMRFGEMAALREIPFGLYYGSNDSTPLFVMLAGEYLRRTGDVETMRTLWPNIQAALSWIKNHGDLDGDGFVEYRRQRDTGLVNQGWKDSFDSIFHADGELADGPIALCEVQAYVYGAWTAASEIAARLGKETLNVEYAGRAESIRAHFQKAFWCADIGTYALALDGAKKQCAVVSSNAGHALFAGIASEEHARKTAARLFQPDMFSGWGIRTVGSMETRYNPMSYHNGSIWPHDNALIALGLARYGRKDGVLRIFRGLMDAASYIELRRLPELFCGFGRKARQGPIPYPVACSPQAWASAAPLALVQASLGLSFAHDAREVHFNLPVIPNFIDRMYIDNLSLGTSSADLLFTRHGLNAALTVIERRGYMRFIEIH